MTSQWRWWRHSESSFLAFLAFWFFLLKSEENFKKGKIPKRKFLNKNWRVAPPTTITVAERNQYISIWRKKEIVSPGMMTKFLSSSLVKSPQNNDVITIDPTTWTVTSSNLVFLRRWVGGWRHFFHFFAGFSSSFDWEMEVQTLIM